VALLKPKESDFSLNGWSYDHLPALEVTFIDRSHDELLDREPAKEVARWIEMYLKAQEKIRMTETVSKKIRTRKTMVIEG